MRRSADAVALAAHVADRHRGVQIASRGLELEGLDGSLAQQRQLHLRHGALHAQQQPVVDAARVIDAILVDDDAAYQCTELKQRVPVAAVACQA